MIVKIPVYFEIEDKFDPDEISELISDVRTKFTRYLIKTLPKKQMVESLGREINLKLLSAEMVKKQMIKGALKKKAQSL